MTAPDVLLVSLGATGGLRTADEQLAGALRRAGADVRVAAARRPREVRTLALTDLGWAVAARRAALQALAEAPATAVVYSSVTAALLWPRPGAIRFDAPPAGNRPGRHGLWQRPLAARRLARAPLLLPWSEGALAESGLDATDPRALVLPVAVAPSGPASSRDIDVIAYAANPRKKGIDTLLAAWRRVRRPTETLVLAGADLDLAGEDGVSVVGRLAPDAYRALVRRARVFASAARREDYGLAQLEALADGCVLATTPSPGPYAALPIARELDPRTVDADVARAVRVALDDPAPDYADRAAVALERFSPPEVDALVAQRLLPRLLAG